MPEFVLDETDRKILKTLQENGRISLADLAGKVGLSASPCLRRVRLMEKAGVIARYVAVLDQQAVGLPVSVFISRKASALISDSRLTGSRQASTSAPKVGCCGRASTTQCGVSISVVRG